MNDISINSLMMELMEGLEGLREEERRRKESKGRGEDGKVKGRCFNIYSVTAS